MNSLSTKIHHTDADALPPRQPNVLEQIPGWFLAAALAILLVNRIGYHLFATPLPDEAYYWLWGQHPALSYYDHPPMQAWFQGITTKIFGISLFALRLPAVLSSIVFAWTLLWWAKKYDASLSAKAKLALLIAAFSSPLFFLFTGIVFNDHVLIALLCLASILAFKALDAVASSGRVNVPALYGAAICIGLAGITKYNASVFAFGVFLAAAGFPRFRPVFRSPHLYLAGVVCVLCLTPVFWWNYTNSAASFQYNLNDRLGHDPGVGGIAGRFVSFAVLTIMGLSPFLFVAMLRALKGPARVPQWVDNWRVLGATIFAVATVFCAILTYFTHVLFYWNIIAFIAILPFALLTFARRRAAMAHIVYGIVTICLINFNFTVLPLSAFFGTPDHESAIPFGWTELTETAEQLEQTQDVDFVMTSDYRTAAILAFLTQDLDVEVIADRISQFTIWFDQDAHAGQDALILVSRWHPLSDKISDRFEFIERVSRHDITRLGYSMTTYRFLIGRNYQPEPAVSN
ncbi:MAG: ArnT family glycosyltransferase [Marinosulfonomonas sp.]